ncbi:MAG: hypothetical protein EOP11_10305 [Proteobacteria bacterium]|nr:MAG: hypothetical protein EOP11_10305 [Pseudomonadota bacterium]
MRRYLAKIALLSLAATGVGCAGAKPQDDAISHAKPGAEAAAPSWRDRLGITSLTNNVLCTYKLLAFFADTRGDRPERRTSSSDTMLSCLNSK